MRSRADESEYSDETSLFFIRDEIGRPEVRDHGSPLCRVERAGLRDGACLGDLGRNPLQCDPRIIEARVEIRGRCSKRLSRSLKPSDQIVNIRQARRLEFPCQIILQGWGLWNGWIDWDHLSIGEYVTIKQEPGLQICKTFA